MSIWYLNLFKCLNDDASTSLTVEIRHRDCLKPSVSFVFSSSWPTFVGLCAFREDPVLEWGGMGQARIISFFQGCFSKAGSEHR